MMYRQKIVFEKPPLLDEIVKVFPWAAKPGVLFSFGPVLYNPSKIEMTPMLTAHEAVHGERQVEFPTDSVDGHIWKWWTMYMNSPTFRLEEEVLAHKAEIAEAKNWLSRHARRGYTVQVAQRLASPLYGNMVTYKEARRLLDEI
jgi:hypothetical protein